MKTLQKRQNCIICSPEEIAYNKGFITREELIKLADMMHENDYGLYLKSLK